MEKPTSNNNNHHQTAHCLFELNPLDCREEIDEKTQRAYQNLKLMIANKTAKECHDIYLRYVAATNGQHNIEELTMGMLVAILAEPDGQQAKYYRDVVAFSKDGLSLFITYLNSIIVERLSKLRDHSVKQIFWITHQLLKANIGFAENVCSNLIRQIPGGDLSPRNLWFIENTLELLSENRTWLINSTNFMVPTVIYTFMRLLADHMGTAQSALRQKEIDFTIGLIRERFLDCCSQIGRDFLRLLYNIVKLPEFEKLWQDIFNNPKTLHANFQSPLQILSTRTPRRLVQSRLTFDMERKINFLATQVKFGNQKRYQDWFHKQYLATPESLSLRCDLIRYICMIIHPSNEVLCSDIIPRWAIIGWLLTTCTTSASANNSKLALFFDWLLYDAKVDNIMNIEPAILVMYYSIKSHPTVTASLLDFLSKIPSTFAPKISDHIKAGIKKSLQNILEKKVIQSLAPLFENPKHDPNLRTLFGPILDNLTNESLNNIPKTTPASTPPPIPASTPVTTNTTPISTPPSTPTPTPAIPTEANPIATSSDSTTNSVIKDETRSVKVIYPFMTVPPIDFKETLNCFDEPIRGYLEDLSTSKRNDNRSSLMDKLISSIEDKDPPLNSLLFMDLSHCLAHVVAEDFSTRIFPASSQESETLEESIASPLFVLYRNIFASTKYPKAMSLLLHLSQFLEATGFLLLYYLRVTAVIGKSGFIMSNHYLNFCTASKRNLAKCLYDDLFMALTYDAEMFCFLLPCVFGELSVLGRFPTTGNIEMIHLVVSAIDPIHLQELICLCMTGSVKVINRDDVLPLIESSLSWESWEQYCLWKLIAAQGTPVENYMPILPKLDSRANPEAMSSIMLILQKVSEPTPTMIQNLINCDHKLSDPYLSSIFRYWSIKTDVKDLAKNISSLFDSRPTSPQVKKAGQTKNKNSASLSPRDVKILQVLESIRIRAPKNKLLVQNEISEMLSEMENMCNESQKKKYSDLFAHRPKATKKQKKMDKEVAS